MKLGITTALFMLCATMACPLTASAQTYTTLYTFCQAEICPNGTWVRSGLIQAADGNFYGTTYWGGANGVGVVFKITPSGALTTVVNFGGHNAYSTAGLIQATDGAFYGTTGGSIFKLSPDGSLTTITSDVGGPAGLIEGEDGDLYGTTIGGNDIGHGGTVFKVTRSGTLTTLYEFCSQKHCRDGFDPGYSGLIQATNGDFYGTTAFGGNSGQCFDNTGCGTVFRMTPSGTLTSIHRFIQQDINPDAGSIPLAGVIQASDGDFYGTTSGIEDNGFGTVFKIGNGKFTPLYRFCQLPNCADGAEPQAGLVQATDGNFYGTTPGTIFQITPSGTLTTLYSDGGNVTGLIQGTDGNFYGTTGYTVFRLSMGLGPFVVTQRTFGRVGAPVNILGTDLTGTTSVTFNGTPATFTVVSATEIKTTVPSGATTGVVQVATPSGTLNSNVVFRVER